MLKRSNILAFILSFFLTLFLCVGTSFIISESFDTLKSNLIITIISSGALLIIMYNIIKHLFKVPDNNKKELVENEKKSKFNILFDKHPFLFSILFIILSWLIYIIAFYPCIMSPDPSFQILQFFGIDNKYSTYVNLIDESVILTNHHPVIHSILIGMCVKIGLNVFNSTNAGLFIYTIIQTFILAGTLSYTIKFLKEINVSIGYRKLCLFIYAFVPVFAFYALSPVKDVIFSSLIILYVISIYKFIKKTDKLNFIDAIKETILLILITLFRNNGFHVIILSFPFLFLLGRKNLFKYLTIFLIVISFYFSYNKVILPHFKITAGSIREMLSVPFQQTARYVKKHENEISQNDKKIIDKVLKYDDLKDRYKPQIADPVKNKFNKDASKDDLKKYFKVWYKGFKKHPITYVEAFVNNTYGYVYPIKTNWYIYTKYNKTINEYGFNYHFNNLNSLRDILSLIGIIFPYIPALGLLVNIGFNTWIILFMIIYLIYKKKYKEIICLIPSVIILMVCFASPVNTYFRYMMPNIFLMPILFGIFKKEVRKEVKNER